MQKKLMIFSLIVGFALALSACAGTNAASTVVTDNTVAAAETTAGTDLSMDDVAAQNLQLAVGVINLRSSQYPIDAAQAAILIPLFQNLQNLLGGTYDASQVQSAVDAIQAALTADQIQAIADMGTLTLDNLTMGGRDGQMNGTPDPNMTPGAGGPGGGNGQGKPQGTPGAGGPGDGSNPPDMQGTPLADGNDGLQNMQATIESIRSSGLQPGLNPDLIGLVVSNLQMIK